MEHVDEVCHDTIQGKISEFDPQDRGEAWDARGLAQWLAELTGQKGGLALDLEEDPDLEMVTQ